MNTSRVRILWFWVLLVFAGGCVLTAVWTGYQEKRTDRVVPGERIRSYEEIPLLEVGDGPVRALDH
ncbi:hypothetical protein AUK40_00290 [Candidatus Wirthbacteria bacterium CG2_30_54_11]|uniref:Uncharacterized protein n=1 Tax=Candidatus Wirthbacteria bacterium CG2_30_54_11 TaxID=1817892 RepID=A0A1J5IS94_9BACT|nr:MAG: hypothetical protein AUK40_00290 [Candidatus Wirthbacteria bacterium CG2_30_54_11]